MLKKLILGSAFDRAGKNEYSVRTMVAPETGPTEEGLTFEDVLEALREILKAHHLHWAFGWVVDVLGWMHTHANRITEPDYVPGAGRYPRRK